MKAKKQPVRSKKRPTIVCFGGGSGITQYLIGGLKSDCRVVAATSMVDCGMSTGQLRKDLGVLPPGDLVKQLAAVSDAPEWKISLWRKRFGREEFKAGHRGHTFGNLFLAGIENITGSFDKALREAEKFLELDFHRAYPATVDKVQLIAELENGEIVEGEDEIDEPEKHDPDIAIKRVFLKPEASAYKPLLKEIATADAIIFGPSDFYSSLIPCLLPAGIAEAVRKSRAVKILVANTVTERGETIGFTIEKFVSVLENYLGGLIDHIIMQDPPIPASLVEKWKKENPSIGEAVKPAGNLDGNKFIGGDFMADGGKFGYDQEKIKKTVKKILRS